MSRYGFMIVALMLLCGRSEIPAAESSGVQAAEALHKAVAFFREQVSIKGGYLWRYSDDLARREGEGQASATTAWVQPPGTPTVGEALLDVYQLTQDPYYLDAARETAHALAQGQLRSGGWDYRIEFDPDARRRYAYRLDPPGEDQRNVSTLDDDTTQSALRYLMRYDQQQKQQDATAHQAVLYALDCLMKAQYPNGAWPQRYSEYPDPAIYPVKKAGYPESWSREYPGDDYRDYYTFNDNAIGDMIDTMFLAAETYGDARYRASAEKAGQFLLLAQMPEPQPAWSQQYNSQMQPAWARKFEPPAVTGGESQGVMRTLMSLYRKTGDKKYLEPIPAAIAYLQKSQLPDGRLARFYELKTNKPLYFTMDYQLTYSSDDMPTHYAFIVGSSLDSIAAELKTLQQTPFDQLDRSPARGGRGGRRPGSDLATQARAVIESMDRGRLGGGWPTPLLRRRTTPRGA